MGKTSKVRLLDVQYAENLERNIISYGLLESRGFGLSYRGKYGVVAGMNDGLAVFDVEISNNVLIVLAQVRLRVRKAGDVLMSVLAKNEAEICQDVQKGSLMHFHKRLAHLNYDTIITMAKDPVSGIHLTDNQRTNCLACAQGKQTKNQQSRQDSGRNSPIDVIGGVI
uniref:Uncharacterized protein AlNc14C1G6 n=1 Tax=Albugo laibachii Nc14 TaxID=890382 RepID=F0VYJ9_9STRA|nr:hypothetical protein PITG_16835 [Albugo laibachii Nc14]|eukprot:CCA13863.1 hypothetical protein PITG_16835 [Albugo laibachii Nc14]